MATRSGREAKSAPVLIVLSDPGDLPELADRTVAADHYLSSRDTHPSGTTVINLCRSYRYRSKGYYVSLVADARGHHVLPAVETLEEMSEPFGLYRVLREAGIPTLDVYDLKSWRPADHQLGELAQCLVLFGECDDARFEKHSRAAYRAWPIPILRLHLLRKGDEWWVARAETVPLKRLNPTEYAALLDRLARSGRPAIKAGAPPAETKRASIAVLYDEADTFSPSDPEAIDQLERIAASMNVYVHRLGLDEIDRLSEYDALFIRVLTGVREPSFQFALRAEMLDMPVLDDPQSIIRCSNKVFLDELLRREGIPTPRTLIVSPRTSWEEVSMLGSPLVVKLPDGSFSAAVHKVTSAAEYGELTSTLFRRSPLLIAQEFLRTDFDWRITLLDGQILFTARYFMAEGHWQIRSKDGQVVSYGDVEAIPRERAPRDVLDLARRAAALIGKGLYGVDIKETPAGPVVIEVNDNPNIDRGQEDGADGDVVYRDILTYFVRKIEEHPPFRREDRVVRRPRQRRHYRPFSVAGMELEYAVVDADLNIASRVEDAFRVIAGRHTSDVELGRVAFSNEIADHVFEVKTPLPTRSLAAAEEALVDGVRRFANVLHREFDCRLLPTGMHPWMDPRQGRLWTRSNRRIYEAYRTLFDVQTHGWVNVHSAHLNLPLGRGAEAVAMHNASALVIPYLPALAASSPMHDGVLQPSADSRMEWIFRHQAKIPESQGDILPEYVTSPADYRQRVLQPMYRALDAYEGTSPLKHDFFNARGAVMKMSRNALEIRVIDTQECVKLDIAVAVFTRAVLRYFTTRILSGRMELPPHDILLEDFRATIRSGSQARVRAPHLGDGTARGDEGRMSAKACLRQLLGLAERSVRRDEAVYLPLVARMIESGSLSERIRAKLSPFEGDQQKFVAETRRVYSELAEALIENKPWSG